MKKLILVLMFFSLVSSHSVLATTTKCSSECADFSGAGPYYWLPFSFCEAGYTCIDIPRGQCTKAEQSQIKEGSCVPGDVGHDRFDYTYEPSSESLGSESSQSSHYSDFDYHHKH